jgi:hypothetical protein
MLTRATMWRDCVELIMEWWIDGWDEAFFSEWDDFLSLDKEEFPIMDALVKLLGKNGTLHHLYKQLIMPQGEFYKLAAVITDPGSC